MKNLLFFIFAITTMASCSLDTNDTTGERLEMVGKEYLDSGIVFKVTDKRSATIESCTSNWNRNYLLGDVVTINGLIFNITEIKDRAFMNNKMLKTVHISEFMKRIGTEAFYGCDSLKEVQGTGSFSAKDTICERAFAGCHALRGTVLGNAYIEKEAFKNCSKLKIIIADTLSYIGVSAFNGCTALSALYISNAEPLNIDASVFENTNADKILYVEKGSISAYQSAPGWKDFTIIKGL